MTARLRVGALLLDFPILSGVFLLVALAVFPLLVADARFAEVGRELPPDPLWVVFSAAAFVYFWTFEAHGGPTFGERPSGCASCGSCARRRPRPQTPFAYFARPSS